MIITKKQLKETLEIEKRFYLPKESKLEWILTSDNRAKLYRYVYFLRKK